MQKVNSKHNNAKKEEKNRTDSETTARLLLQVLVIAGVSCLVYSNVINAPLLYDDQTAILANPDVQEKTEFSVLWSNDFWGFSMQAIGSHRSYRPFTVIVFRTIHHFFGNWSTAYHVVNLILHAIVSVLFFFVCRNFVFDKPATFEPLVAGLMFASHPIHTEAVCGAVGCAELLSAICFMISLLVYSETSPTDEKADSVTLLEKPTHSIRRHQTNGSLRHRKIYKTKAKNYSYVDQKIEEKSTSFYYPFHKTLISLIFATAAMLCKESGATVLGSILIFEIIKQQSRRHASKPSIFDLIDKHLILKSTVIILWGFGLLYFRLWMMSWGKPTYTATENPASYAESRLTRILTYFYLCWFNFLLLLCPTRLSYDYSYGTIPLINSPLDLRNCILLAFLTVCVGGVILFYQSLWMKEKWSKAYLIGFSMMVLPFLPASNLFFPVGFVIAERILYLPSSGFIILFVILGAQLMEIFPVLQRLFKFGFIALLSFYLLQTFNRNYVWTSKENLFRSGLQAYPENAKIQYNIGYYLQTQNNFSEAYKHYKSALKLYPNHLEATINIGGVMETLGYPKEEALKAFQRVIELDRTNSFGHANLARVLSDLGQHQKAIRAIEKAYADIPSHVGRLQPIFSVSNLLYRNSEKASSIYFKWLHRVCQDTSHPVAAELCSQHFVDALNAYIEKLTLKGKTEKAAQVHYIASKISTIDRKIMNAVSSSFKIGQNIEDVFALLSNTKAVVPDNGRHESGEDLWEKAKVLFRMRKFSESKVAYESYLKSYPNNLEALGQYGSLLSELGQAERSKVVLSRATDQDKYCDLSTGWYNLASFYGSHKQHEEAIILLSNCLKQRKNVGKSNDKISSAIHTQLGNHQIQLSKKLKDGGKKDESKMTAQEAAENLRKALEINPFDETAQNLIKQIKN